VTTLIIGSTAAKHWLPGWREPKDLDLFSDCGPTTDARTVPHVDVFWHSSFADWLVSGDLRMATLDELYTIKVSHSYWVLDNGTWEKHMRDIVQLKQAGARLDLNLHTLLYKVWEEKHGKKKVNLDMTKDEFFSDAVERIYDHDSIHYSVAYGDKPIYEAVFVDGQEIAMDMRKIKLLPHDECVKLFREEIYATALERWVIPSNYRVSPMLAYTRALKKTITSLTKGWSARFIVENYAEFRRPDIDYVAHHKSKSHLLIPLDMEK
jgi:hypothetical protein